MAVRMQVCMLFAALALCLLVPASEAKKLEWKYCKEDEGAYEAKLDKVVMTPDPAQAGKDINVTINGNIGACLRACLRAFPFPQKQRFCPRPSVFVRVD